MVSFHAHADDDRYTIQTYTARVASPNFLHELGAVALLTESIDLQPVKIASPWGVRVALH